MEKHNWIAILGKCEPQKNGLKYVPQVNEETLTPLSNSISVVKTNIWYESGTVKFNVLITDPKSGAQVILNHDHQIQIFVGIGAGGSFGIQAFSNGRFENLAASGGADAIPGEYEIEVKVIGSRIRLFVNGVNVCNATAFIKKCQPALFFRGSQEIIVKNIEVHSAPIKAFVVMQFTPEFNDLYSEVIKPTVEKFGIECVRADDIYTSDSILAEITQSIIESIFVIADITPNNPNVFYEVGYAHAINKPVILLSDNQRDKLPFDISGFRVILYSNSIAGKSKVEARLIKHIENVLNG